MLEQDPVAAGTKLQLPVYALAAQQRLGGQDVEAQYWFVRRDRGKRIALGLDVALRATLAATVGTLVSSIASGYFPAKAPEQPDFRWVQCPYCNPDKMGHREVREQWERKRHDAVLADLIALIDPRRYQWCGRLEMSVLSDQDVRDLISTATHETIFVEAGAGSGKTRCLVDRIITLSLRDGVPISHIAAVTFTEKAGAELRDRLRAEFESQLTGPDEQWRLRATTALEYLDSAAIGTLHSFAQRILTMHAIEAGLPPLIEVLDEVASSVAFDERWSVLQRELLNEPTMAEALLLALSADVTLDHLRSLTRAFSWPLAQWIASKVYDAAQARAAEGRLEFHDLLVLARGLVRGNAEVRASLQRQFPRLLLDEFQDTDPIQIELAVRIAGGAEAGQGDWAEVRIPPVSLFVVGDPKQSIYRFRRASISMYLATQEWFGHTVRLATNFRTVGPVLDWVNQTFAQVIRPVPDAQPPYEALDTFRPNPTSGPAVTVVGSTAHQDKPSAGDLRIREASDVAAVIQRALREGWTVLDVKTKSPRLIRLGDIAILLPARTSLRYLEEALDWAGITYRAESSSLVYEASEVRSLLVAARAVADPSDGLACVTALRSPLFGCGDDDLWTWKWAGGTFNLLAPVDATLVEHPVGRAMSYLRHLHNESRWLTPSEVLTALISDRRMLDLSRG